MIESVNNEHIKNISKLNNKKYREEAGLFIVEGEHLVEMAREANLLKEELVLNKDVSLNVMKKITSLTNVPRVLAVCNKKKEEEIKGNILILDNIQDPGNLGTIIRSAVAFGIDTVVASSDTVDVYNPKVIRSSEGAIFKINYLVRDLVPFINSIKNEYKIYTTNVHGGKSIKDFKLNSKYALIMGNEGNGVSSEVSNLAHDTLYIPISSNMESLNVSIATSIILYEFSTKNE